MIPGWYMLKKMLILVGNIAFDYDVSPPTDAFVPPGARAKPDLYSPDSKQILVWAPSQALAVDVSHSDDIRLSESRSVDIRISSGWNDISAGTVTIRAASAGLRLHTAQAEARGSEIEPTNNPQPGAILFHKLKPGNHLNIRIPYNLEIDLTVITVRVEVAYLTQKGQFTYVTRSIVPVGLPVAVNVQETFKKDSLFSLFTIRSATSSPIRVIDTRIEDNAAFEATASPSRSTEVDVYSNQPFSVIAQVRRKSRSRASESERQVDRRLHLIIEYRCLNRTVLSIVEAELLQALATAHKQAYSRLLSQHLASHLRSTLSPDDFELFGLLDQIALGPFEEYGWEAILQAVSPTDATKLEQVLQDWHLVSMI